MDQSKRKSHQPSHRAQQDLEDDVPEEQFKTRQMPQADRQDTTVTAEKREKTRQCTPSRQHSQIEVSQPNPMRDIKQVTRKIEKGHSKSYDFAPKLENTRKKVPERSNSTNTAENRQNMPLHDRNTPIPKSSINYRDGKFGQFERDTKRRDSGNEYQNKLPLSKLVKNRPSENENNKNDRNINVQPTRQINLASRKVARPQTTGNQSQRHYDLSSINSSNRNDLVNSKRNSASKPKLSNTSIENNKSFTTEYDRTLASRQLRYDSLSFRQKQEQDAWASKKLNLAGACPTGLKRLKLLDGYYCEDGGHYISDEDLAAGIPLHSVKNFQLKNGIGLQNWVAGGSGQSTRIGGLVKSRNSSLGGRMSGSIGFNQSSQMSSMGGLAGFQLSSVQFVPQVRIGVGTPVVGVPFTSGIGGFGSSNVGIGMGGFGSSNVGIGMGGFGGSYVGAGIGMSGGGVGIGGSGVGAGMGAAGNINL